MTREEMLTSEVARLKKLVLELESKQAAYGSIRTEAGNRLSEEDSRYRTLFEQSPDGILIIDTGGGIVEFNEAAHTQLGYSREEFSRLKISDIDPQESPEEIRQSIAKILEGGSAELEVKHRTKDGEVRDVRVIAQKMTLRDKLVLQTVWKDITAQKRMEAELLKVEKLESLGVLAGGIAHDFNNLLVGILGNLSLARSGLDQHSRGTIERLEEAEKACLRAKGLTHQLLAFSRSSEPVKETVSVADMLRDACIFCLSGSNVKCRQNIPEDTWPVDADASQISQVLNNLIINADQAMPYGGTLSVECRNVTVEPGSPLPLSPGRYVRISLRDTGEGIAAEHLSKIFDPYFTTKQRGSGLGLATSYSIVNKHEGYIDVSSEVAVGTTFSVYLPASDQARRQTPQKPRPVKPGSGRVLLMDDEEMVRLVSVSMLQQVGYEPESVETGEKAIMFYRRAMEMGRPFAAVILDLTVRGGLGGAETVKRLLEIDPGVRAIVFSGYSDDPAISDYQGYGFKGFLSKPCTIGELAAVLNAVISRRE